MAQPVRQFYEFGPFRLDVADRRLLRDGRPIPLRAKLFDTLLHLVQHAGHLVEKDDREVTEQWPARLNRLRQEIRFCTTGDGVRIAYATAGEGPPLVKTANWLNHLEFDWESPIWRHLLEELARANLLVRYDERGNGLSDWRVTEFLEIDVRDLLPRVRVPTLVFHCRDESVVPFEQGRLLAAEIPGSRLVELPGRNHLLLEHEPAWGKFLAEVGAFLRTPAVAG